MGDVEKKNEELSLDIKGLLDGIKRNKKTILLSGFLGILFSSYFAFTIKRTWEGEFQIVLNEKGVNQTAATILGGFANLNATNELDTKVEILKSPSVLLDIYEFVKIQNSNKKNNEKIGSFNSWKKNLKIKLTKGTTILNISYVDKDKDNILQVLEKVSEKYKKYSVNKSITKLDKSINYFENQIALFKIRSLNSLKKAQEFGQKYDLLIFEGNSNSRGTLSQANLAFGNSNNNQISNISIPTPVGDTLSSNYVEVIRVSAANKIRKIDEQLKLLQNSEADEYQLFYLGSTLPNFQLNPILSQIQDLEKLLVSKKQIYKKNDKDIIRLSKEKELLLDTLKNQLIGNLKGERIATQATYESARRPKGVIIKYQQLLKESARDDSTLNILEGEKRKLELQREKDFEFAELITEPTLYTDPVGPNRKKILFFGGFLGFLLGSLISKLNEYKKGVLLTTHQAEKLFSKSCLDFFKGYNVEAWNEKINILLNLTLSKVSGEVAINVIGDFPKDSLTKFVKSLNKDQSSKKFILVSKLSENANYQSYLFLTSLEVTKINEIIKIKDRLNSEDKKFLGHIVFSFV